MIVSAVSVYALLIMCVMSIVSVVIVFDCCHVLSLVVSLGVVIVDCFYLLSSFVIAVIVRFSLLAFCVLIVVIAL